MNAMVEYRSREAVIHPYVRYKDCGDIVDDILRRLGNVETDVSELKADVRAISAQMPHLATKEDLTPLKVDIEAIKTSISDLKGELKVENAETKGELRAEIASLRTELKAEIAGVRTAVVSLETKIIKWIVATVLTATGVAFSIARFVH